MESYIGITDIESKEQASDVIRVFGSLLSSYTSINDRKLMIGVMMSLETLTGRKSKWSSIWPSKEKIADIFIDHELAFNTLHYADYDNESKVSDLLEAVNACGENLHAIQLDMIWPRTEIVQQLKKARPELSIVLQVGGNAIEIEGDNPESIIQRLESYDGVLDYVLLDKSMGKGKSMDSIALLPFVRAISEYLPRIGVAVAGGLGPRTMHFAEPIIKEFPNVSIDAQGRLRPRGDAMDPISLPMVYGYLRKSCEMLNHYRYADIYMTSSYPHR
jgi:hypothetical protein